MTEKPAAQEETLQTAPVSPLAEKMSVLISDALKHWTDSMPGKPLAQVKAVAPLDEAGIAAAAGASGVVVPSDATSGGRTGPLLLVAGEQQALDLARLTLAANAPGEFGDAALAAFGDAAKTLYASLEGACAGMAAVHLVPGEARKGTLLPPDFPAEGAVSAEMTLLPEGGQQTVLKLIFSAVAAEVCSGFAPEAENPAESQPSLDRILGIYVPVVVQIARKGVTIKEALAFKPGTVLEFDKKSDDLLELKAGKALIGTGEAVKVGESFGLRVLEVGSVRERIQSLAK